MLAACCLLLALVASAGAWAQAPSPGGSSPLVRVGLRQGAFSLALSCPAGLRVLDAEGAEVLAATGAVRVEPARPGTPPTPASPPTPPAEAPGEVVPDGGQAPPADTLADQPGTGAKLAIPPVPEARALLTVAALDADGRTERSVSLAGASLRVVPTDPQVPLLLGRTRYRGAIAVARDKRGRLSAVNVVSVDDYLRGVLPVEMSASAPLEALKAQAIVARTFALTAAGRHNGAGFDLCDNTHCEVYAGAGREREATDRAVAETRGQVLLSGGRMVPAYFHSNCGGATDSAADVWGGKASPAGLPGVSDLAALSTEDLSSEACLLSLAVRGPEVYCGASSEFHWEFERTRADLERTLSRTLPGLVGKPVRLGKLQGLSVVARTCNGRAAALDVRGSEGTCVVRGDAMRWAFGTGKQALPSARFVVRPVPAPDAPEGALPQSFRFFGFGSGHGVGMCQAGAVGMARAGHDAAAILAHYFPGAAVGSP